MIPWLKSLWQDDRRHRRRLLIVNAGLIAFWAYSIAYILHHPAEKGSDGFEVFLTVPMTAIALFFTVPALLFLIWRRTIKFSAPVTLAAIAMNVLFGSDILWNSGLGRGVFWPIW